jgi:hypothetical protein
MADAQALVVEEFMRRLEGFPELAELDDAQSRRLGREAAEAVIGPIRLRRLLGEDRLDTTQVARLLAITRQAVHKRVKNHALLGVPGRGTTWFPAWQFDTVGEPEVRPLVVKLLATWAEHSDEAGFDPHGVLIWAATGQPELGDQTPEDWIVADKEPEPLLAAARAAARALAS